MTVRMTNTPKTVAAANSLSGTTWTQNGITREITRVENAIISPYDRSTVLADIYWRKPGGKERKQPTPLSTFRTRLNKSVLKVNHEP